MDQPYEPNNNPIRKDIDYQKIQNEIQHMSLDLINCKKNSGPLVTKDTLMLKYEYTYSKTPNLFEMVFKEYGSKECMNKINMMLNNVIHVKQGNQSRHDASVKVGEYLAKEYIFPHINS